MGRRMTEDQPKSPTWLRLQEASGNPLNQALAAITKLRESLVDKGEINESSPRYKEITQIITTLETVIMRGDRLSYTGNADLSGKLSEVLKQAGLKEAQIIAVIRDVFKS